MAGSSSIVIGADAAAETEVPLLSDVVDGSVDCKGRPVYRSKSGGWKSASFIIFVELAERFAYYGINSNLINYLTGPLGQSTATAAENVNAWAGTASLSPLLGAFVADSFLGRYRTIIFASSFYVLGLGFLTVLAVIASSSGSDCKGAANSFPCSTSELYIIFFFFSLYLVAVAQGGHKPCVQAFGADQFDTRNLEECKAKSSFFNWWYFGMCGGNVITISILNYVQDNLGWGLGFGIPCIVMALSLVIFLLGTKTYRFSSKTSERNQLMRISLVFVKAIRNNWKSTSQSIHVEEDTGEAMPHQGSQQFKCLDKALVAPDGSKEEGEVGISDVEDAKAVLRLVPIWTTCLVYAIVFAQVFTFFTKQGVTMDRSLAPGFEVPAAALQSFISISVVVFIPIYDRILVPVARGITGKQSGITVLQRIGTGLILSVLCLVIAALVERKRLETALEYSLVDLPKATVPMSVAWLIPQYLIFGIVEVFAMVGLQEFFYDQVPSGLRSIGLSLYLSIFGVGSFLSSFLISIIQKATNEEGQDGWFSNNLNRAHLDSFYWLLAGLSVMAFIAYLYFSKSFIYARGTAL